MAVHCGITRPIRRRPRRRKRRSEECGVRARQAESRDPERDDRDSFFRWSEQQRKGAAEHGVDNDRIKRGVAVDVGYPRALMRYRIGKEVLQSEAELGGARRDVAAFGKALVELPIVDVDLRAERDESSAGRLGPPPGPAPGMHDHFVAATNEVLGNRQQRQDVTGYRGSGDEKSRHVVLSYPSPINRLAAHSGLPAREHRTPLPGAAGWRNSVREGRARPERSTRPPRPIVAG